MLSPKGVYRLAIGLLAMSLAMLVLTLLIGPETNGARRWLPIGGLVVQPGEFAKPALVVVVAGLLARAPGLRQRRCRRAADRRWSWSCCWRSPTSAWP